MKSISNNLKTHIASEVTTLATCWKITRRDAVTMGFTDHDCDLVVDGVEYQANSGFSPSAVQSSASLAVDNMDVEGVLDSITISEADLMAGVYDFAEIEVFIVNYRNLGDGKLRVRTGWLGEVSISKNRFVAEVRGLAQKLNQNVGSIFSSLCRAKFCDQKCKLDEEEFTFSGGVDTAQNRQVFTPSGLSNQSGYFNYGKIIFTSGANSGLGMEVKDYIRDERISLALPMPYEIEPGDSYDIVAGCDKNFKTCTERFVNAVNFRGEPHIPGLDEIMKTAGTR